MLTTRKQAVTLITKDGERAISLTDEELANGKEIESLIIPELVHIHQHWIQSGKTD
jgi:phosphopantothenate-cysteine ligase